MAIVKLLVFASCWPVLIQAEAVEDVMPAGDDVDDECASPGCALQALQSRAKTVVNQATVDSTSDKYASVPGVGDDGWDDLLPDPDDMGDEEDDSLPDEEEGPSGPGLCGTETYDHSKEGCCGSELYDLTTQSCCGNDIFDIKDEDCCNETTVYNTTKQGCCNHKHVFNLGEEYLTFGLKCIAPAKPPWNTQFDCTDEWPPKSYAETWSRYCAAKRRGYHMAWAMTRSCEVGWLSVIQRTQEDAKMKSKSQCQSRSNQYKKETCYIFDFDGKACHRQRCGNILYDATMMGCCNGEVFDSRTHACCAGTVYETKTTGCCNGKVYHKEPRRCCGGKHLFNSNTHGCCLEKGPQVFRFGKQNCCAAPKGICKIPTGALSEPPRRLEQEHGCFEGG
eukprot:s4713_g2.t1